MELFGGKNIRIWKWSKYGTWRKEERKRKKAASKIKDQSEFLSDFVTRVKRMGLINVLLSLKVWCHNRANGWKNTTGRGQLEHERRKRFLSH